MKERNLTAGKHYWLKPPAEETPTLVYYYLNPDAECLGFGFNIADGGGFLPEMDLTDVTEIVSMDSVENAMEVLKTAMDDDPDYAWGWHCNLAMAGQDKGLSHKDGNDMAAGFMGPAFNVDTNHSGVEAEAETWVGDCCSGEMVGKFCQCGCCQIHERDKDVLSGSEAIYGFASWLTCRKEKTILSASDESGVAAERCKEFCDANGLEDPRPRWEVGLTHPAETK